MFLSSGCVLTTLLTTYIAVGNWPKSRKNMMFVVQAGTFFWCQAGRSSAFDLAGQLARPAKTTNSKETDNFVSIWLGWSLQQICLKLRCYVDNQQRYTSFK